MDRLWWAPLIARVSAQDFELGFGSCAKQYLDTNPWYEIDKVLSTNGKEDEDSISATSTLKDLPTKKTPWIWMGDAAYLKKSNEIGTSHVDELLETSPAYNEFKKGREILGVWDDHDAGLNDYIGTEDTPENLKTRQEIMRSFFGMDENPHLNKDSKTSKDDSLSLGPGLAFHRKFIRRTPKNRKYEVHFVALDLRSFNTRVVTNPILSYFYSCSNTNPIAPFVNAAMRVLQHWQNHYFGWMGVRKPTLVGEEQWSWLERTVHGIFVDEENIEKKAAAIETNETSKDETKTKKGTMTLNETTTSTLDHKIGENNEILKSFWDKIEKKHIPEPNATPQKLYEDYISTYNSFQGKKYYFSSSAGKGNEKGEVRGRSPSLSSGGIHNYWFTTTLNSTEMLRDSIKKISRTDIIVPKILILGSSIQILTDNPVFEGWHHAKKEKKRLLELLRPYKSRTILVSGDVHFAETMISKESSSSKNPELRQSEGFLEVTSSGITHKPFKIDFVVKLVLWLWGRDRVQGPYVNFNFGRFGIDQDEIDNMIDKWHGDILDWKVDVQNILDQIESLRVNDVEIEQEIKKREELAKDNIAELNKLDEFVEFNQEAELEEVQKEPVAIANDDDLDDASMTSDAVIVGRLSSSGGGSPSASSSNKVLLLQSAASPGDSPSALDPETRKAANEGARWQEVPPIPELILPYKIDIIGLTKRAASETGEETFSYNSEVIFTANPELRFKFEMERKEWVQDAAANQQTISFIVMLVCVLTAKYFLKYREKVKLWWYVRKVENMKKEIREKNKRANALGEKLRAENQLKGGAEGSSSKKRDAHDILRGGGDAKGEPVDGDGYLTTPTMLNYVPQAAGHGSASGAQSSGEKSNQSDSVVRKRVEQDGRDVD